MVAIFCDPTIYVSLSHFVSYFTPYFPFPMSFFKKIFRPKLQAMNTISIYKSHILHNMGYLQSFHPHASLFPVLKSNAYGHGLEQMTKILESYPTPYLVVDSLPEYFLARKFTKKKFLLLGETLPTNYKEVDFNRVTFAVYNQTTIEHLLKLKKHCTGHLFLNTGMNREGIDNAHLSEL